MSTISNTSILASEYISQELRQQNNEYSTDSQKRAGTLSDGKTVSDAARDTHVGGNAAAERDVVTISEEARNMQKNASQEQEAPPSGSALSALSAKKTDESKSPSDAAEAAREAVLKQIKEVKEKIADAKERLAVATANTSTDAEDPEAAAMMGLQAAVEVESIQQEIDQLSQQLQLLYQQMQEQSESGGGSPAMGTAGIGGPGTGEGGGLGERISVG